MKIHFDKVETRPWHTLNPSKLKLLVSLLPEELKSLFNYIHVGNQLPEKSRFDRPVILSMKRLNVLDRGVPESQIIREICVELQQRAESQSAMRSRKYNRLDPLQLRAINEIVNPLVAEYEELVASM
ncbi:hypothetical protein Rhal01_03085 [Rubritalea halochordaticola]|uniref:Uncharacterized protein n=1 Tax=Rubritalea halochordaticola TaxID=714537 RepID=A0ABP9V8D4_9BACT